MSEELKRLYDAKTRTDLSVFAQRAFKEIEPGTQYVHNWHVDCISEHLMAIWDGDCTRLIINIPPRFMKTLLCSVFFPAWAFIQNPSIKFINTSFKFDLAKKMTRRTRGVIQSSFYQGLAPHVQISHDQNEKHFFETTQKGHYYSSAMSSVTGEGADIQICDDPINPAEANSDLQRANAIETIRQTLFSRFNNSQTGRFILVMQRLHEADPTGDLLQDEGWTHLKLPAEVNKKTIIEIRGKKFEYGDDGLLFPKLFDQQTLDQKKRELGAYAYAGQYLQRPAPIGGGEFKKDWIQYFEANTFDAKGCNIFITVDPATSKKKTADYTAIAVWALAKDKNMYLVDGIRERLNPSERIQKLFEIHQKWNDRCGKPARRVGYEAYGLNSDIHWIEEKQKQDSYRFGITQIKSPMKKEDRIRRLIPMFEEQRIYLPSDMYYKDDKGLPQNFISDIIQEEMMLFPFARHDDFIDAMAMVFDLEMTFPNGGRSYQYSTPMPESIYDL